MYAPAPLTTPSRAKQRVRYDRETVHAILDEGMICHLAFIADGRPVVLPSTYVRQGERVYLHGSTGSRPLLLARDGVDVCFEVTLLDGLVLARSAFHHSVCYRSVVAHGRAELVTDQTEKRAALAALVDHLVPGRSADCREPSAKELSATAVLRLDLEQVSAKVRGVHGPGEEPEDLSLPYWGGVLPLRLATGEPIPDEHMDPAARVPEYLTRYPRAALPA